MRFEVYVRDGQGRDARIIDQRDSRVDGRLRRLDAPLDAHAGLDMVCLHVAADGNSGQDAAFWVDPRIESPS